MVHYGVRKEDERIDFDEVRKLAEEHKPRMIVTGGSAYSRILDFARFREIADSVGALLLVDMAHFSGSGRRRRASQPLRVRRYRHLHYAQDLARAACRA